MAVRRKLLRMIGPAAWENVEYPDRGRVTRAILRDGRELVMDVEFAGWSYSVNLERAGGDQFRGTWLCQDGDWVDKGPVAARLYSSDSGYLLFGEWTQGGDRYQWWVELSAVKHFPDELPG
jgi:hypothetical protein